ncbi:MAG: anti-sigma factor [Gemmatimonadota bacterium]
MSDMHLNETRLHDAADGSLAPREAEAVRAHLDGCVRCAAQVRELRDLLERARELGGPVEPERELWDGIQARIRAAAHKEIAFPADRTGVAVAERRATWSPALRVAASVALLLVGGVTGVIIARAGQAPVAQPAVTSVDADGAVLVSDDDLDPRAELVKEYESPVAELQAELERRRGELAPEIVVEIERNLEIVDRAIEAARAAFDESPGDPVLPDMLHSAYGRKVELLERAVGLPRTI